MSRRITAGLSAAVLATTLAVAMPMAASAETYSSSCTGTYLATRTITNDSGTVIGRVGVYRDGNYMCAILVKAGPVYGVATKTTLTIGSDRDSGSDYGNFAYRTDAIRVYAPNHQVWFNYLVTGKNGKLYGNNSTVKG